MNELTSEQKQQIRQLMENLERAKLTWISIVTKIDLDLISENIDKSEFYIEKDELVNIKLEKEYFYDEVEPSKIERKVKTSSQKALRSRLRHLDEILTRRAKASFILGIISLTSYLVLILIFIATSIGGSWTAADISLEVGTDFYTVTILHGIVFGALSFKERIRGKTGLIMNLVALVMVLVVRVTLIVMYIINAF